MSDEVQIEIAGAGLPGGIGEPEAEPEPQAKKPRTPAQVAAMEKARAARGTKRIAGKSIRPKTADDVRAQPGPTEAQNAYSIREDMSRIPEDQITRRKREDRDVGAMQVPRHMRKMGWDLQWIAIRVLNEPVDSSRIREFREGGWRPVLAREMPDLADDGQSPDSPIESYGQRLYTRPMRLTIEAKEEDLSYALRQQHDKMRTAAEGSEEGLRQRGIVRPIAGSVALEGVAG